MVTFTQILSYSNGLPRKFLRRGILDTLRLHVKGGTGGSGLPRYGGLGGSGGNVYITSRKGLNLEKVKSSLKTKRLAAEAGSPSSLKGIVGTPGEDVNIDVPLGITIYNENGVKLGEVNKDGEKLLVAKGGLGGCPDTGFCGLKGQAHSITLDFKLIADVGLVGFPNAGKSTLLNNISRSKPKIAAYPFTTIKPQVGIVRFHDDREISIADLPGLIEDAHLNVGMGRKFLKHLERVKLLLFVVDIQGFQLSPKYDYRSCLDTIVLLNREIELYKPDLLDKPAVILINKMDTDNAEKIYEELEPQLKNLSGSISEYDERIQPQKIVKFDDILTASLISKKQHDIQKIKDTIRTVIDKHEEIKYFSEVAAPAENRLVEKLKRATQQHTPTLI